MYEVNLKDKVVVVTGAGGRLGRRVAHRFAQQGATIAAIVLNEQQAHEIPFPEQAEGWAFPADVTNEKMVQGAFRQIAEQFGQIDALIHTVGMWESTPLGETGVEDWDRIMNVNLKSTFLCFREAIPLMQRRGGRLISLASQQGADRGRAKQAAYSAAKAGVIRLVESVAEEMRGTAVTAHVIAPSFIIYEPNPEQNGVESDKIIDLCLFLCTPAGDSLNGTTLRVYS